MARGTEYVNEKPLELRGQLTGAFHVQPCSPYRPEAPHIVQFNLMRSPLAKPSAETQSQHALSVHGRLDPGQQGSCPFTIQSRQRMPFPA